VDSGAALPRALFDKIARGEELPVRLAMLRQMSSRCSTCAALRLRPGRAAQRAELLQEVRERIAVMHRPSTRFPNASRTIFAGGYAAGYYSYKWAEVSRGAYGAFEEAASVPMAQTGARFRDEVLASAAAAGGGIVRAFRGASRASMPAAHNGMIAA